MRFRRSNVDRFNVGVRRGPAGGTRCERVDRNGSRKLAGGPSMAALRATLASAVVGLSLGLGACASAPKSPPDVRLKTWGEMRQVLREGKTQARVNLKSVVRKGTWGVGALANLAGEITVLDGKATLSVAKEGKLTHPALSAEHSATLLALAEVKHWQAQPLIEARTLGDLERVIASALERSPFRGGGKPVPIRIEGSFVDLGLHVIAGSCPVANPDGPSPWRWRGGGAKGTLVGIYAEGMAGKLTHHGQRLHLHAVLETAQGEKVSGHLDSVLIGQGAQLFLPAAGPSTSAR